MPPSSPPSPGKKAPGKKPVAKWQSWEKGALDKKFRIIAGILSLFGILILTGIGYIVYKVMADRPATVHARSTLINSHPPELPQPFICDLKSGFQSGGIRTFLKNVGNSQATNITSTFKWGIVPERKVGIAAFDEIPNGNCRDKPWGLPVTAAISAGQESSPRLPQPVTALPPLLNGEGAQLYGVSCVFYSDASGADHAACDTYRFRLASGTPVFMCDGGPKTGKFEVSSVNNCAN